LLNDSRTRSNPKIKPYGSERRENQSKNLNARENPKDRTFEKGYFSHQTIS
jgi:hypothetical protein